MATNASACPAAMKATSNGLFQGDNPLHFSLPLATVQICLVVALTRILAFLLRPLRQPRVIAEIVVSPSSFLILYWCIFVFSHDNDLQLLFSLLHINNKDLDTYHKS